MSHDGFAVRPKVHPNGTKYVVLHWGHGMTQTLSERATKELHRQLGSAIAAWTPNRGPAKEPPPPTAQHIVQELEEVRQEEIGKAGEDGRRRLRNARLLTGSIRIHTNILDAVNEYGIDEVRDAYRWGCRQVALGKRETKIHANTFGGMGGGFAALQEAFYDATEEDRQEKLRLENEQRAAAERAKRDEEAEKDADNIVAMSRAVTENLRAGKSAAGTEP